MEKYTHSYTKGTIHHDLLPASHPDWGGTGGQVVEGPRQFSSKDGTEHLPGDRNGAGPGPQHDPHPGGTQHQSRSPEALMPEAHASSSLPVHDSGGTSQDL